MILRFQIFFLVLINKDDRFISILENDRVFLCIKYMFPSYFLHGNLCDCYYLVIVNVQNMFSKMLILGYNLFITIVDEIPAQ